MLDRFIGGRALWVVAVFAALLLAAPSASADVLRLDYTVTDLGSGVYDYEFTLTLDNADGTWTAGDGFGWLIVGDANGAPSPLTGWTGDATDFPVGPWTGWSYSGGAHNGPTLSSVTAQWIPTGVGDSVTFSGTSTADLAEGDMLFSNLQKSGTSTASSFTPAFRDPCPGDQTVECEVQATIPFYVDDIGTEDVLVTFEVDGTAVPGQSQTVLNSALPTYVDFDYTFAGPPGTNYLVEMTKTTTTGGASTCSMTATTEDTLPPVLTLLGSTPLTIECGPGPYVDAGATAADLCAGDLTSSIVVGGDTVLPGTPGTYVITYNVSDPAGNAATPVSRTVNIVDTTPPVITSNITRSLLWPPRLGLMPIGLAVSAEDSCAGTVPVTLTVYSDEAAGAAPYAQDSADMGSLASLRLRAERLWPTGDGRVYLLVFRAEDPSGNVAFQAASVVVPRVPTFSYLTMVQTEAATAVAGVDLATGAPPASHANLIGSHPALP